MNMNKAIITIYQNEFLNTIEEINNLSKKYDISFIDIINNNHNYIEIKKYIMTNIVITNILKTLIDKLFSKID